MTRPFRIPATATSRTCTLCKVEMPLDRFITDKTTPTGRGSWCKECKKKRAVKVRRGREGVIRPQDITRFWARVDKNGPVFAERGPCWVWQGAPRNKEGYGQFHLAGRNYTPHTVMFLLRGVVIDKPRETFVDHECRNRMCLNPDHLRFVDPRTNAVENNSSPFAANARKTHCKQGHEFNAQNTAWLAVKTPGSRAVSRMCLACFPQYRNSPRRIPPPNYGASQ